MLATSGNLVARHSVRITPRDVTQKIEFVGHARVSDRVTADLWAWEGIDGRDYAAHGTWNAEGHAYFYDVTDPANMELIDKVQVDARTVNDVKVSEDGRICVISREGASNRRNGIVILDVSNPRDVKILSQFDDHLTGEVHKRVRLSEPRLRGQRRPALGRGQHRGSEEAGTGGTLRDHHPGPRGARCLGTGRNCFPSGSNGWLDCGGCRGRRSRGVSEPAPVEMGRIAQLTGWNHAVWPFRSKSAGKFYVLGGDEEFYLSPLAPESAIAWKETLPSRAVGWIHFVEFDDMDNPKEVARYQLLDSGPHNYWIDWEQEIMYIAHFQSGLRIVDISGGADGRLVPARARDREVLLGR